MQTGVKVSGGRLLMEKIVFVSRDPGNHEHMLTLIETLFPECRVEIITGSGGEHQLMSVSLDEDAAAHGGGFISQED